MVNYVTSPFIQLVEGLIYNNCVQVNTTTGARFPYIAMADDGRFAVAWDGEETILAQLFDENGNAVGGEIDAVPTLKNNQSAFPYGIDMDANGNFAVPYRLTTSKSFFDILYLQSSYRLFGRAGLP